MKKILGAILMLAGLANVAACAQDIYSITDFKGMVDIMPADKLEDTYSPDCQNVRLGDRYESSIEKRQGSQSILSTVLPEGQPIRNTYNYTKVDGTKYLVFVSSLSLYYTTLNGASTKIKTFTNIASTATFNFTTAKNSLYGFSASTTPFKWDGTTLSFIGPSISTNMVTAAYGVYHNNRMWRAGVSGNESTLYYSEVNDPENIGTFNYLYIDVSNGQNITGLLSSGGKLYVFKTFSAYEVVEVSAGSFVLRQISKDVGALYQKGITEYRGFPTFLSHRGVEVYDGQLNLISRPLDNLLKDMVQLNPSLSYSLITTKSDMDLGTKYNSWTYSGGGYGDGVVQMTEMLGSDGGENYWTPPSADTQAPLRLDLDFATTRWFYLQAFYMPEDVYANSAGFLAKCAGGSSGYEIAKVSIVNSTTTLYRMSSENDLTIWRMPSSPLYSEVTFSTCGVLTANTTYFIYMYIYSASGSAYDAYISSWVGNSYLGTCYRKAESPPGTVTETWAPISQKMNVDFGFGPRYSSWTSTPTLASGAITWGTFTDDSTIASHGTLNYYIKFSTASDNFVSKPGNPYSSGQPIGSQPVPYYQIIASMTRTNSTDWSPISIKSTELSYTLGNLSKPPVLGTYKDNLWVAISTETSSINNMAIIFDQKNNWIPYNKMYISDMCVINNTLYTGASNSAGTIYQQDITGLYTDAQVSGAGIDAYWCTKVIDCNLPFTEKTFDTIWITAANSGNWNISCDYRLDGTDGTWTEIPVSVYNSAGGLVKAKINLPQATKGYSIQLRIRDADANEYYQIRRIDLFYKPEPPR